MKYIVDLPNEYVAGGQIDVPVSINGYTAWIKTGIVLIPYVESDTDACINYLHKQGWLQDHDKQITESEYKRGYKDGIEAVVIPEDKVHEAYQRGYSAGKVDAYVEDAKKITKWIKKSEEAYQKGIDDAWESARKIVLTQDEMKDAIPEQDFAKVLGHSCLRHAMRDMSAAEAIDRIRQYEQEKEEIKVGDEVQHRNHSGIKIIVLEKGGDVITAIAVTNVPFCCKVGDMYINRDVKDWKRTGKHYVIAEILRKMMREE